jgi:hypothetical protein
MTNITSSNPHKEEDEGYLAAQSGQGLSQNPYPRGTIRYEQWKRGWCIRRDKTQKEWNEGCIAAEGGQKLSQNPYPRGTIRYEQWRHGWHITRDGSRHASRLVDNDICIEKGK